MNRIRSHLDARRGPVSYGRFLRSLAVVSLVVPAAAACAPDAGVTVLDLVAEFDTAGRIVERDRISFGRPFAREVLLQGWAPEVERRDGEPPFLWGVGRFSAFDLPLIEARPLTLTLQGRPRLVRLDGPGPPGPDAMRVEVNAWSSPAFPLHEAFHAYEVVVPEDAVGTGPNRVEFHYLRNGDRMHDPTQRRERMAWRSIQVAESRSLDVPRPSSTGAGLDLPFHTRLDYFVRVPRGTIFSMNDIDGFGPSADDAVLEVEIEIDGASQTRTVRVGPSWWRSPADVPITSESGGPSCACRCWRGPEPMRRRQAV